MTSQSSKKFFIISFLPALAYWYLEANYPLRIALSVGLGLALVELILEKALTKHLHTISIFNFVLILLLGALSFAGDEGLWFKLQPAITGIVMGLFLFWRNKRGCGLLEEMTNEMHGESQKKIPAFFIKQLDRHLTWLFTFYGLFMVWVCLKLSTDYWIFFKTIGFYLVFFIFMIFEIVLMRKKMKQNISSKSIP